MPHGGGLEALAPCGDQWEINTGAFHRGLSLTVPALANHEKHRPHKLSPRDGGGGGIKPPVGLHSLLIEIGQGLEFDEVRSKRRNVEGTLRVEGRRQHASRGGGVAPGTEAAMMGAIE